MTEPVWNPMSQMYDPAPLSLADFLLARIDEEEDKARRTRWGAMDRPWVLILPPKFQAVNGAAEPDHLLVSGRRILAECEAKRQIVEMHRPIVSYPVGTLGDDGGLVDIEEGSFEAIVGTRQGCMACAPICSHDPCDTLKTTARPYADHPAFRPEWRVG